ncbi:hypothetical protein [Pseudomonas asplenii]|uniref:hypothetical protein n=1 Tax=Pseudomonas asplenii TaxID=53407 RepID=UPI0038B5013F
MLKNVDVIDHPGTAAFNAFANGVGYICVCAGTPHGVQNVMGDLIQSANGVVGSLPVLIIQRADRGSTTCSPSASCGHGWKVS